MPPPPSPYPTQHTGGSVGGTGKSNLRYLREECPPPPPPYPTQHTGGSVGGSGKSEYREERSWGQAARTKSLSPCTTHTTSRVIYREVLLTIHTTGRVTYRGLLIGGLQCRLSISRNGNIPCNYFWTFSCRFKNG